MSDPYREYSDELNSLSERINRLDYRINELPIQWPILRSTVAALLALAGIVAIGFGGCYGCSVIRAKDLITEKASPCVESVEVISHADNARVCEHGGMIETAPLGENLSIHCKCPAPQ